MKNEHVIVRDYAGKPRLARVSSDSECFVYVVGIIGKPPVQESNITIIPVGFKRTDVFRYSPELLNSGDWSLATPY